MVIGKNSSGPLSVGRMVVIFADVNDRSVLWYNNSTDERGETLENLIVSHYMMLLNVESDLTIFENTRGNIDITMCYRPGRSRVSGWKIITLSLSTDHRMIS